MAVSVEFFPLAALRSATAATRVDLEKIRSIAGAVRKKIAEISNRSQFTPAFIAAESGRIREQGMAEAKAYLEQRETMPRVQQIASQEPLWNTAGYLSRALTIASPPLEKYDSSSNQTVLLQTLVNLQMVANALLSFPRMSTAAVSAATDAALQRQDWAAAAGGYNELLYRGTLGDDTARRAANRVEQEKISDVETAQSLIVEAAHTSELLNYALRAVASGDEDMGLRMERYAAIETSRRQAAAA